jgi:hypothetical protein
MNILTEEERETAVRCITEVAQGGGQAVEASADGKLFYAYQEASGRIGWGFRTDMPDSRKWSAR